MGNYDLNKTPSQFKSNIHKTIVHSHTRWDAVIIVHILYNCMFIQNNLTWMI